LHDSWFPSIEETWSLRELLDHVGATVECILKDTYIDMYRCMHFSDDWEINKDGSGETYWEDIFQCDLGQGALCALKPLIRGHHDVLGLRRRRITLNFCLLWEDIFQDQRFKQSPDVEKHHQKYVHIEDGYNSSWKEVVSFSQWLTADESRVAGWYQSGITIGPEPKPI
jgi:hypothetical protein